MSSVPDWRLPAGVSRSLQNYFDNESLARCYDKGLEGNSLIEQDRRFLGKYVGTPGSLIDLGCGTGRTLMEFAGQGCTVFGVDLSEEMLRVALEKTKIFRERVHLVKGNIVDLRFLEAANFDYASCLFSTLGMISRASHRAEVVRQVYRILKPGGKFVLHVHSLWHNVWDSQGRTWVIKNWLRSFSRSTEKGNRAMPVHQGVAGLTLHHFTKKELRDLLEGNGFRVLEILPVNIHGRLRYPFVFGGLRSYGYLAAASKLDGAK